MGVYKGFSLSLMISEIIVQTDFKNSYNDESHHVDAFPDLLYVDCHVFFYVMIIPQLQK